MRQPSDLFLQVKKMLSADELEDPGTAMEDTAEEFKAVGAPRGPGPAETGEAAPL